MSMFRSLVLVPSFAFVSMASFLACQSPTVTTDSTDALGTSVDALTAAKASYDEAATTAKACFEAFDTCVSADGADEVACKTTLSDCLPEAPPPPEACADGERGPKGGKPPPPNGKGGHGPGESEDDDDDDANVKVASASANADPGIPPDEGPGAKGGKGGEGEGRGGKHCDKDGGMKERGPRGDKPGFCGKLPVPHSDDVKKCRDDAKGASKKGHHGGYDECVKGAYDSSFGAACAEAKKLCSDPNAPAEVCAKVDALCASDPSSAVATQ